MQNDYGEAVGRLNAGEPIAPVDASLIERAWKALSQLDAIQRNSVGIQLGAVAGNDSNASALSPDQRLAFGFRYALLDALLKRGILDRYMEDVNSATRCLRPPPRCRAIRTISGKHLSSDDSVSRLRIVRRK